MLKKAYRRACGAQNAFIAPLLKFGANVHKQELLASVLLLSICI
jgi:hypothetical protein